jgi:hypothetical protein
VWESVKRISGLKNSDVEVHEIAYRSIPLKKKVFLLDSLGGVLKIAIVPLV